MASSSATGASALRGPKSKRIRLPESEPPVRTPLLVPAVLNRNLEFYCTVKGMSKNAAVLEMIKDKLREDGYDPTRMPRLVYD
jgi:hypothetical protein